MSTIQVRPIKIGLVALTVTTVLAVLAACGGGSEDKAQSLGERVQPLAAGTGPTVSFAPASITMSANPGSKQDIPVVITAGSAMSNVTVNVPTALKSVLSVAPASLGSLTSGQAVTVSIKVAPGASEALHTLSGAITVRAGFAATSKTLPVSLALVAPESINGIAVPPEPPKELNDLTLAGFDLNANGVRDDVERYISSTYLSSQKRVAVLFELGQANQESLLAAKAGDRSLAIGATRRTDAAVACLNYVDPANAASIENRLAAIERNTKQRWIAIAQLQKLLGGVGLSIPADKKAMCTFDPDSMPN